MESQYHNPHFHSLKHLFLLLLLPRNTSIICIDVVSESAEMDSVSLSCLLSYMSDRLFYLKLEKNVERCREEMPNSFLDALL